MPWLYFEYQYQILEGRPRDTGFSDKETVPGTDYEYFKLGTLFDPGETDDGNFSDPYRSSSGFDYFLRSVGVLTTKAPEGGSGEAPGFGAYSWAPNRWGRTYLDDDEFQDFLDALTPEDEFIGGGDAEGPSDDDQRGADTATIFGFLSSYPTNVSARFEGPEVIGGPPVGSASVSARVKANFAGVSLLQNPGEFLKEAAIGLGAYASSALGLGAFWQSASRAADLGQSLKRFQDRAFDVIEYGMSDGPVSIRKLDKMSRDLVGGLARDLQGDLEANVGLSSPKLFKFVTGINLVAGPVDVGIEIEASIGTPGRPDLLDAALPDPSFAAGPPLGGVSILGAAVSSFEGSEAQDIVVNADYSKSRSNDDKFSLLGGSDRFVGGARREDVFLGRGADQARGGGGDDDIVGQGGGDRLWGQKGDDNLWGSQGGDRLYGNAGEDALWGGGGRDVAKGGGGFDRIWGNGGGDKLFGGAARDVMYGGGGRDVLRGGPGDDRVEGGPGPDTFIIDTKRSSGTDLIADFNPRLDHLVVRGASKDEIEILHWRSGGTLLRVDGRLVAAIEDIAPAVIEDLL